MSGKQNVIATATKTANRAIRRSKAARRRTAHGHDELWSGVAGSPQVAPLPKAQRQIMAAEIGRMQGNGHLLRTLAPVQRADNGKKQAKPITTPIDKTATINKKGAAELKIGEITVVVSPDDHTNAKKMKGKAHTSFKVQWGKFKYKTSQGVVTEISSGAPPPITVIIQTVYGPGASASEPSAYGRGTTAEDRKAGNTSLGFHEGRHGLDYMAYLKKEPLPAFAGAVGMSVKEFKQAVQAYQAAVAEYTEKMDETSEAATDCVGEKADFCVEQSQP